MAPCKLAKIKKVTAISKSKTSSKRKGATTIDPLEKVDLSTIAILGERRDNAARISREVHDFDLLRRIPHMITDNPGFNICISGGSPELSYDAKSSTPTLIATLVPHGKLPPPFVAYSVKDELKIEDLSSNKLSWVNVAPRVYVLKSTKRLTQASVRALSADALAREEHRQLYTIIPRDTLQRKNDGKLDIRRVNYSIESTVGDPITGVYEKGLGLNDHIEMLVDQYGEELGHDPAQKVMGAIKEAFEDAREVLEEQATLLHDKGYDDELLDAMKTIKMYSKTTSESEKDSYINAYYGRAHKVL